MRVAARQLWAHRSNKWIQIASTEIYPGDIILLSRDKTKPRNPNIKKTQKVPCDLLILSGSAVVNEAILTGESQPQVKDSIANLDEIEEALDINGEHKANILNSGTDVLQYTPSDNYSEELSQLAPLPTG